MFGYAAQTQPKSVISHDRLTLGFGTVALNASERITANHRGSLGVYQSQGAWNEATKDFDRSGGELLISHRADDRQGRLGQRHPRGRPASR